MNTTFDALQEQLRPQADLLSNMRRLTNQMDSIKRIGALAEQMERFSSARMIQEQAKKLALTSDIYRSLGLSASSGLLKTITEMTSRTAYLSSFGLNIDALQSITNKVNIGSSTVQALAGWNHMDRLLGLQGLNEMPGHLRLAQQLQHQFLGRLSLQEYAGRLTPPIPALSAIETARDSFGSLLSGFRNIDWSAIQEIDDSFQDQAAAQIESISGNAAQQLDLQGAVDQIVAAIAAQHRPEVRLALTVFFSRLFWCILGAVMQVAVSAALASYVPPKDVSQSTQATAKQIKEAAQAVSTPELIAGLRYVNDTQLNVRINPHHQTQTHSEERPTGKK